jgi:hypothetical protein
VNGYLVGLITGIFLGSIMGPIIVVYWMARHQKKREHGLIVRLKQLNSLSHITGPETIPKEGSTYSKPRRDGAST